MSDPGFFSQTVGGGASTPVYLEENYHLTRFVLKMREIGPRGAYLAHPPWIHQRDISINNVIPTSNVLYFILPSARVALTIQQRASSNLRTSFFKEGWKLHEYKYRLKYLIFHLLIKNDRIGLKHHDVLQMFINICRILQRIFQMTRYWVMSLLGEWVSLVPGPFWGMGMAGPRSSWSGTHL